MAIRNPFLNRLYRAQSSKEKKTYFVQSLLQFLCQKVSTKGAVFTIMAMLISSIFVFSASIFTQDPFTSEDDAVLLRIQIVDGLTAAFIDHAHTALRISTYEALDTLSLVLGEENDPQMTLYFKDFGAVSEAVRSCVLERSWAIGVQSNEPGRFIYSFRPCVGRSLPPLLDNFTALAKDVLNVDIDYELDVNSFRIYETVPYQIFVNFTMNITVVDLFANWTILEESIGTTVSLFGIRDPVTSKFTYSPHANDYTIASFMQYNFTPSTITKWNSTQTISFITSRQFRLSPSAPSIMGRYYGNFSPSPCCGIETLLNASQFDPDPWERTNVNFSENSANYSLLDHDFLSSTSLNEFIPETYACSGLGNLTVKVNIFDTADDFLWLNQSALTRYNISGSEWELC